MGGSGSGNQSTQSTNTASYPAEFQPIAKGAASQILAAQSQLPLAGFTGEHAANTAGISPFQQATMNMAPGLLAPSWGLGTLQNMGQPVSQLANNAIGVGNQNTPYTNALAALASGGFGGGRQSFPGAQPVSPFQMQAPTNPAVAPQATVMGPNTNGLVNQLTSQLSSPVPQSTPTLPAFWTAAGPSFTPPSGGYRTS